MQKLFLFPLEFNLLNGALFPLLPQYQFFIFPLLFLFILKPYIQICKTLTETRTAQTKLPPGSWKLPIIGNLLQMVGSPPHHALMALAKKHGPIFHLQLGEISTIVVSSAELAKEALVTYDHALASRRPILTGKIIFYDYTDVGLCSHGNYWRQMRKICTSELLSVTKVRYFRFIREEEVWSFTESIRTSSGMPFDFSKKIYALQNAIICRATIGVGCKDQDTLIDLVVETLQLSEGKNMEQAHLPKKIYLMFC